MKSYIINGMFLCQRVSGIQRYAIEIMKRLDNLSKNPKVELEILVPYEIKSEWKPVNIPIVEMHLRSNVFNKHYWLNVLLPKYAKKKQAITVNLCNLGPICSGGIICIHDIMYKSNPNFFPWKKRIMPLFYYYFLVKNSKKIITVSQFTKNEILLYYGCRGVNSEDIEVIGNGWEHVISTKEDDQALAKYGLNKGNYYVAIGNISPHKNFKWIVNEANNNPEALFVIIGQNVLGLGVNQKTQLKSNTIFTGYITDNECKALLMNAKALLFPSICEGFGIPPLEILALGGDAIVSNRSCMPEIFGDSVVYIDPFKDDYNLSDIRLSDNVEAKDNVLKNNSWDLSAKRWLKLLENL